MKITVIGGTGLIGRKVVEILREHGEEVVAASPETGVNTLTGQGLREALQGTSVLIDVSNSPSLEGDAAMAFFKTAGMNIADEALAAGVKHHVALSVVGTDRLPDSPYLKAKLFQEKLIRATDTPYTIVHATQFFEFVRGIADAATTGDLVRLPHALFQPMAASDVAGAVAKAALAEPANGTIEVGGPEKFYMDEIAARVLAFDEDPRRVIPDADARYFGARIDDQSLVPGPDAELAPTRFDWWLENVPRPAARPQAAPAEPAPARA